MVGGGGGRWCATSTPGWFPRLQHGCQDDFHSPRNPGVKQDHFAAFIEGRLQLLPNPQACAAFYQQQGLAWPYDAAGRYTGPGA